MIYVVKKIGAEVPFCVTRNKNFAYEMLIDLRCNSEEYFIFTCDDAESLIRLMSEEVYNSLLHLL